MPIDGFVGGKGKLKRREFAMASGEMSRAEFEAFLTRALGCAAAHARAGAIAFVCMDWRHMGEVLAAGGAVFDELKNLCVWAKSNGGLGSLYRSQHELVFVFKKAGAAHINNVELGRFGRNRTNVWSYPGVNAFGATREAELAMHPTVKPLRGSFQRLHDKEFEVLVDLIFQASGWRRISVLGETEQDIDLLIEQIATTVATSRRHVRLSRWRLSGASNALRGWVAAARPLYLVLHLTVFRGSRWRPAGGRLDALPANAGSDTHRRSVPSRWARVSPLSGKSLVGGGR